MRALFASCLLLLVGCGAPAETSSADDAATVEETAPAAETDAAPSEDDAAPVTEDAAEHDAEAAPPPPPPTPGPKLKVMSFNIRVGTANDGPNDWVHRKELVYKVLRNQDADLVGLQEDLQFQLRAIDENVAGYQRIGVGARDGKTDGEYCAILYRGVTLALKDSGTFWLSGTPNVAGSTTWGNDHPRVVTWGRFAVKATGYEFYLYNTHFDHASQNSREESAELLMARIAKRAPAAPFIVMGDLNVQEDNVVTRYFKGNAKLDGAANPIPLFDTFRVLHPDEPNARTAHGFTGAIGGQKIDYIYLETKNVLAAQIDRFNEGGRYPSDHYPIVATVKLPAK